MKKTLLSIFTAIAAYGFSQSTILITNVSASQTLAPNATVNIATNASSNSQVTFDIKNTSGSQQSYNAIRYDITLNAGAAAYYCFAGTCYGPSTFISPTPITLNSNQSASQLAGQYNMLVADLDEGATVGVSVIKYTFKNVNNSSDSVQVTVRYNSPTNIKELNRSLQTVQLSPNPAESNTSLKLNAADAFSGQLNMFNSLGSMVKSENVSIHKGENKVNINVSELPQGIYFLTLSAGEATITKRLIVK